MWARDLTYVWTLEGWLYLSVLLDLYSRRVVGWAMGQRLMVELAEQALTMAVANRAPTAVESPISSTALPSIAREQGKACPDPSR